jgi:phosphohistidine swiveling domain-containing protein
LLQVRPLPPSPAARPVDDEAQVGAVSAVHAKVAALMKPHPYLHGARTVLGVMPDWNPAEIVGIRPRPLALSLYRELITDNIWAYQRDNYGYRNLRSFPLIISLAGLPYIDVRVSFNSFVPASVDARLSDKLVNYYIDRLIDSPSYHDKVEFEIIFSCYTLDLPQRLEVLKSYGFSAGEIEQLAGCLRTLTNGIIHGERGFWRKDIERVQALDARRERILRSDLDEVSKLYWLIEDCKRYGTLPFAGLARAGFIAVQILKSLVAVGVLSDQDYHRFMNSLDTIGSRMTHDFVELDKASFLQRYGHLRPGTYDLLSPRYDETPERYFDWSRRGTGKARAAEHFTLSIAQFKAIEALLDKHGLDHDVVGLLDFIKHAIEGREHSKFLFTKSLSDVLSIFRQLGEHHGFDVEACTFADIACVKDLYGSSAEVPDALAASIERGRAAYPVTTCINLPPLITGPEQVWSFHLPHSEPNYITLGRVTGHTALQDAERARFVGAILLIPSADPGYDWIFSQGIAGFITMYGGANSHMAIRAAELNIPAVIGAGESLFTEWAKASQLEVDCANRQVKVLR